MTIIERFKVIVGDVLKGMKSLRETGGKRSQRRIWLADSSTINGEFIFIESFLRIPYAYTMNCDQSLSLLTS